MNSTGKKTIYRTMLTGTRRSRGLASGVLTGLASLLTFSAPAHATMRSKIEAPEKALRGDFVRIGMDMRKAAANVTRSEKTSR